MSWIVAINLDPDEVHDAFGEDDPNQHREEARRRWGTTDAYRESERRTNTYSKEDWILFGKESEAVNQLFIDAMTAGYPADSAAAKDAAEAHRRQIDTWFYACSYDMHTGLAEMYVLDPRFTQHYDNVHPGLAKFISDAIIANALDHM